MLDALFHHGFISVVGMVQEHLFSKPPYEAQRFHVFYELHPQHILLCSKVYTQDPCSNNHQNNAIYRSLFFAPKYIISLCCTIFYFLSAHSAMYPYSVLLSSAIFITSNFACFQAINGFQQ